MKLPRIKDYEVTSMEQIEVSLLVVCLLLHFAAWTSITVNGETVFEVTPFAFGPAFICMALLVFISAILSKFVGRFSGFTTVVFVHMATLAYLAYMAAKRMSGIAEGIRDFGSAFGATEAATKHISTGGVWIFAVVLAIVLGLFLLASWGVSAYRLSKRQRQELRNGYLWGMGAYLVMGIISLIVMVALTDHLKASHFGGGIGGMLGGAYTVGICGIAFFVMLMMLIVNFSVWLLCEALRSSNKRAMMIVAYVLAVLFFLFFLGVTSEKSKLALSMPSSIDDLVLMLSEYGAKWVGMSFAQLWLLAMSVTCVMRGIFFTRHDETKDEASEEVADEEAVVEEEKTEATTLFDDEEEENPNKKYYIGGGVAAAVLLAAFLLFKSCSGGSLLHGQKPSWDKFVVSADSNVPLYKEADASSPVLMLATENIESDAMDVFYCWEGEDVKRGYSVHKYEFSSGMISPVLEETDGWYKVQVSDYGIIRTEAWVQKRYCREIKPTPVTPEVLDKIGSSGWNHYHMVKDGKLKNLVLHLELSEMDGYSFELAELMDDVLVTPEQHSVYLGGQAEDVYQLSADGNGYRLTFTEDQTSSDEHMTQFFDPQKLTAEQVQQLYKSLVMEKPTYETVYYYFPEVNDNMLYGFFYRLTDDNTSTSQLALSSDGNEVITDYRVLESDGDCILEAMLGEKSEATDIRSSLKIVILDINDYDGDGNKECLIQEDGGGSAGPEPPYIVYYDSEARQYRKTETIDNLGQTPEVVTENGQTSILFRRGIQWVRYVFENHAVRETENDHKDMGEAQMAVTTSMLFREDEIDSKKVECDLDDDGIPEVLTLSHNDSHASNFGKDMMLDNITWGRDQSETSTYMMGERFVVLKSKTNNVRDLLMDYFYYRWDGTKYVPWMWNGDSFILVQEQD